MKSTIATILALSFLVTPAFSDGHATGDAKAGEAFFKKCKACHSIVDPEGEVVRKGGKVGPNLYGLYGRIAGENAAFGAKYGDSIREAGEQGLVWNENDFVDYVADPKKFLATFLDDQGAKSKMGFKLKKEDDVRDVWAYLVSVGPEVTN
jgi:cytochrome c